MPPPQKTLRRYVSIGPNNDKLMRKTMIELIIYVVFLICITYVSYETADVSMYHFTKMVRTLFVEDGFEELRSVYEFYEYVSEQIVQQIYGSPESKKTLSKNRLHYFKNITIRDDKIKAAPENTNSLGDKFLLNENLVLGPVRIRQLRVRSDSCSIHELFHKHFMECFGEYNKMNEFRSSYGLGTGTAWTYHEEAELDGTNTWGQIATYPRSGYYIDFTSDYDGNKKILQTLRDNDWIDRGTRVALIQFTIYNANINQFSLVKLIAEFPTVGGVITSHSLRTVNLLDLGTKRDLVLMVFELICLFHVLYYTYEEATDIYRLRTHYLTEFWNIIDLSIILISYAVFVFTIFRSIDVKERLDKFNSDPTQFINFDKLGFWQDLNKNFIGICAFLVWIKILKYLGFNKTMLQFSTTLARCTKDLLGFGFMFLIVFIAYAQLGYILFGTENENFRTFIDSIFTLMRTILGDFDYLAIEKANRILGPIYFLSYIFFVFFVLLNMFLAIINDTYSDVKSEITTGRLKLGTYMLNVAKKWFRKICLCGSRRCCRWLDVEAIQTVEKEQLLEPTSSKTDLNERAVYQMVEKIYANDIERMYKRIEAIEQVVENVFDRMNAFVNTVNAERHQQQRK